MRFARESMKDLCEEYSLGDKQEKVEIDEGAGSSKSPG